MPFLPSVSYMCPYTRTLVQAHTRAQASCANAISLGLQSPAYIFALIIQLDMGANPELATY